MEDKFMQEMKEKYYSWCSDNQWKCCEMVFDLIGGEHHLCGKLKEYGSGIEYNTRHDSLATYDFNLLTRMVFMAHDRLIRVEIKPSGPGMLKWCLWQRTKREGSMFERHPTIETALNNYRKTYQEPDL